MEIIAATEVGSTVVTIENVEFYEQINNTLSAMIPCTVRILYSEKKI